MSSPHSSYSLTPRLLAFRKEIVEKGARSFDCHYFDPDGGKHVFPFETWDDACNTAFASSWGHIGREVFASEWAEWKGARVCVRRQRFLAEIGQCL